MAVSTTLYRFQIELADVSRSVYETLDFRVAQHPSEVLPYLLSRVIAFALNHREGLTFSSGGLSDPDAPAMSVAEPHGGFGLWIEIGNPSARKLHKAAKASKEVLVYTYKNPEPLIREIRDEKVHRAEEIGIYALPESFLSELAARLGRDNRWSLLHDEGTLTVQAGEASLTTELTRHSP